MRNAIGVVTRSIDWLDVLNAAGRVIVALVVAVLVLGAAAALALLLRARRREASVASDVLADLASRADMKKRRWQDGDLDG